MKAWELLDEQGKWTKRAFARTRTGKNIQPEDARACCWDVIGAVRKCYPADQWSLQIKKLRKTLFDLKGHDQVYWFNDCSANYEDVATLLKEADV